MLRVLTSASLMIGFFLVAAPIVRAESPSEKSTMSTIKEHMDVVGSDAKHVGTVDKFEGSTIKLTKNDPSANGEHHSIPSSIVGEVKGNTITLSKTAQETMADWNATGRPSGDPKK